MPALVGYNSVAASVFLMRKRSITSQRSEAPGLRLPTIISICPKPNLFYTVGEDYIGIDTLLTFEPTMDTTSVMSVNVTILNDIVNEGNEGFEALLNIFTPGIPISFFPSNRAPATILDDDSELNNFYR